LLDRFEIETFGNEDTALNAENSYVSTSKRYQLFPKQKLMQTNSLVTSMTFMFLQ